ncbi:hypothetical protein SAMN05421827_107225 [Pedobacter terrae]|uniref:Uncharacterized protein n=1 Tax=Pedobacter terrae TaxID=405671 RepID=A0A1G7V2A6_9SPHI|nr:hypothetical protein SAMN05421827_107225 [Pedobacter terrae]
MQISLILVLNEDYFVCFTRLRNLVSGSIVLVCNEDAREWQFYCLNASNRIANADLANPLCKRGLFVKGDFILLLSSSFLTRMQENDNSIAL